MLYMERVSNMVIEGITWKDSPMYHMYLRDIVNFLIQDFEITVDVVRQQQLMEEHGYWDYQFKIPTFPLNTDGIDPSGMSILIRNVTITNYDDAVAVKPANKANQLATCA